MYTSINAVSGNGQFQLLQELKDLLLITFPTTPLKADGQIVKAPFKSYRVEIVPALPIHEERRVAVGKFGSIGWHTFRHTYRSWLDETGAPMKVQQELMCHTSIQTTMNVYGQAMTSSKREANGKVVEMVLKPVKVSA